MSRPNKKARTETLAAVISGMSTDKERISKENICDFKASDNGTNNAQYSKVEGNDRTGVEKAKVDEDATRQSGSGKGGKEPLADLEKYEHELDDIEMEDI